MHDCKKAFLHETNRRICHGSLAVDVNKEISAKLIEYFYMIVVLCCTLFNYTVMNLPKITHFYEMQLLLNQFFGSVFLLDTVVCITHG